jgi:hypothetical protein
MLIGMRPTLVIGCILFITTTTSYADTACSPQSQRHAAVEAAQLRKQLLAIKVEFMSYDMPAPAPVLLERFKIALMKSAEGALACHGTSVQPSVIQSELAGLLHANPSAAPDRYSEGPGMEKPTGNIFASDLHIHVFRASSSPRIFAVQFTFGITCGDDNVLLLFQADNTRWKEAVRWRVKGLDRINDAFGDFFVSSILPGASAGKWRLITAHGKPWCTSNWSAFNIDVLAPTDDPNKPRLVSHREEMYLRYVQPKFVSSGNTVSFRTDRNTIETEELSRTAIFRYQLVGDNLQRIQPIATNGRYFVDEWLQIPWSDAVLFSDPSTLSKLKAAHDIYAARYNDIKNTTSYEYGPVLACRDSRKRFQVQIAVDDHPTYYSILENGEGYTMLSANSTQPDPACNGSDLMKKH